MNLTDRNTLIRWGIIGCGDVTEVKSGPSFNLVEGFRLDMVLRRDAEKLRDYARRHKVPRWTTDADLLINDPDIEERRKWCTRKDSNFQPPDS